MIESVCPVTSGGVVVGAAVWDGEHMHIVLNPEATSPVSGKDGDFPCA